MSISADRVIAVRTSKTVYRDGETVLKVFLENVPGAHVLREAMNQSLAEEAGLRVPSLYEVVRLDGKWAIRSRYVRGKTLRQHMESEPERTGEYAALLARLHAGIHRVRTEQLFSMRNKWIRRIREAPLPEAQRNAMLTEASAIPEGYALCHGELTPSNILLSEEDGEAYILDWSHAARGFAAADAAMSYLLLRLHDPSGEQAQSYLQAYCARRSVSPKTVLRCAAPAAASVLSNYRDNDRVTLTQYISIGENK